MSVEENQESISSLWCMDSSWKPRSLRDEDGREKMQTRQYKAGSSCPSWRVTKGSVPMTPGFGTIRGTHSCVRVEVMGRKMQRQQEEAHCTGAHGTDFPRMHWCLLRMHWCLPHILSALKFSRAIIVADSLGGYLILSTKMTHRNTCQRG